MNQQVDEFLFFRRYVLLVLVGGFFSLTEETKILGEMIAITFLLGIIRYVHVGALLSQSFSWFYTWVMKGPAWETEIKRASVFPIFVMMIGGLVVSALLMFVIPQVKEVFMGMRIELPVQTTMILGLSDFLNQWWALILPMAFGGPLFFLKAFSVPAGREVLAPFVLKTPLFGSFYRGWVLIHFFRLVENGVREGKTRDQVIGHDLEKVLAKADLPVIRKFLESDPVMKEGAENDDLERLLPLLKSYEKAILDQNRRRIKMTEIGVILMMGAMTGLVVMSVFMPMRCLCNCAAE